MTGLIAVVGLTCFVAGMLSVALAIVVGERLYRASKHYPSLELPTWETDRAA